MNTQQLRNSILQLAIQGKLVPQDPSDEPASVLLERIRKEKEQLVKEGKLKPKDLVTTPVTEEEMPFKLPNGWEWCRTKSLFNVCSARRVHERDWRTTGIPFYRAREIGKLADIGFVDNDLFIDQSLYDEFSRSGVPHGNDLMVTAVGTLGKVYVVKENEVFYYKDGSVLCLENIGQLNAHFLKYVIESPFYKSQYEPESDGTTVATLTMVRVNEYIIPLPPLSEQHRIVAKLEELLPLVEQYGKAQDNLDALNNDLPRRLRQSILQEAIQGKLVPQDPSDEPASVLLERIRKEKEQLVKEGKLKKKDLITTPVAEEEIPFDIPDGWEWAKVGNIFQTYSGGTPEKGHPEYYSSKDVRWAKVGDLGSLYLSDTEEYISNAGFANSSAKLYPEQTVLVAMYCNDAIGKSSVTQSVMASNQAICGLLPNKNILPEYVYYAIQYFRPSLIEKSAGGAQKNINQKIVNDIIFPLPPLAEQRRIVAKIEQLFAAIDNLK